MTEPLLDSAHFRRVFACLPTGVTVITAYSAGTPVGMAANSVTSVSLDPLLVLFCPARSSETWPVIRDVGAFCINIMAGHHEDTTRRFAAKGVDRFAEVRWTDRDSGPALDDAAAWIECRLTDEHDAGDHTIVVARVVAIEAGEESADALIFHRGAYSAFPPRFDEARSSA
jgi:3-hydroxy-9,10-secoandrosta-1,3,5(10)-triene-9,17-dione monooxygenase reductase component